MSDDKKSVTLMTKKGAEAFGPYDRCYGQESSNQDVGYRDSLAR